MSAYVIGEVEVSDEHREDFENIFLAQAHKELEEVNAKIVGGGFNNAAALIGLPPKNRFVVIQFENVEALQKWWDGPSGAFVREKLKAYGNAGGRLTAAYEAK